ncbi:hypothetical protein ALC56_14442 [Trachymyrmex septentrionalis]|uniref:Uncharacterized protein n=1 Tax=Trachymyrmex septentrionalis TaxID=34720 RepID=A0A151JT29_9HYME|nr:hypothetical protein ALC56_14442 [Trachymyrmex septentrionalis]
MKVLTPKEIKVELDNVHSKPRLLTVDHKRDRVTISKQCLEMFQCNPDEFLRRFITVDEVWRKRKCFSIKTMHGFTRARHRWPNSTNSATNCFRIQPDFARFSLLRLFPVSKPEEMCALILKDFLVNMGFIVKKWLQIDHSKYCPSLATTFSRFSRDSQFGSENVFNSDQSKRNIIKLQCKSLIHNQLQYIITVVRCLWCKKSLCLKHFFIEYHYCNEYNE